MKTIDAKELKQDPANARRHDKRNVNMIADSLLEVGAARSGVIDEDGHILAGNATWEALEEAGIDRVKVVEADGDEWVVVRRSGLSERQKKRLAYFDNRTAELADWNPEQVMADIASGLDLDGMFFENEIEELLAGLDGKQPLVDAGPQIDKAAELQQRWNTKLGQVWELGEHRLACGDCTDKAVVEAVIRGEKADLVFTDPPYNVAGESKNFAADVSASMGALANAEWDKDFDPSVALDNILSVLAKDASVYVCTSHFLAPQIWTWMKTWAAHHSWCAWHKTNPMPSLSKRHWTWDGELIPYATRGRHVFNFPALGHAPSVWDLPKSKETSHPTEKPVKIPEMAIKHSSNLGQIVFDPFLGSGTTLIACERLNRKCRAIEIEPKYIAVTLQRWSDLTSRKPKLVSG